MKVPNWCREVLVCCVWIFFFVPQKVTTKQHLLFIFRLLGESMLEEPSDPIGG